MTAGAESAGSPARVRRGARRDQAAAATAQTPVAYVGLVTRAIAFAIDAAVINGVAIAVDVGVALILSVVHVAHDLKPVLLAVGGVVYVLWAAGYFVGFWSGTGQTPGNRLMQIRVVSLNGQPIKPRRAVVRCAGLLLAALPLFAGYVIILFNDRRRGLQDYMGRTVVVGAPQLSVAGVKRAEFRAAHPKAAITSDGDHGEPAITSDGKDSEMATEVRSYDSGDDHSDA